MIINVRNQTSDGKWIWGPWISFFLRSFIMNFIFTWGCLFIKLLVIMILFSILRISFSIIKNAIKISLLIRFICKSTSISWNSRFIRKKYIRLSLYLRLSINICSLIRWNKKRLIIRIVLFLILRFHKMWYFLIIHLKLILFIKLRCLLFKRNRLLMLLIMLRKILWKMLVLMQLTLLLQWLLRLIWF